jgi:hypothetical protein
MTLTDILRLPWVLSLRPWSPYLAWLPNHRGTHVLSSDWWKSGSLTPLWMHGQNLKLFKTCLWRVRNGYPYVKVERQMAGGDRNPKNA